MNGSSDAHEPGAPRWLPWAFLTLLVLPFHPFWVDFEQVRRGLLLVLAGLLLALWPALPHARGERVFVAFIAWLGVGAAVNLIGQLLGRSDTVPLSFQPW
ncbi:MAG TPA: hypothetical protein VFZ65_06490, partial [Planctomycetota bacterium]|nr:hypothetical protein [Planctomycetota bacterium]